MGLKIDVLLEGWVMKKPRSRAEHLRKLFLHILVLLYICTFSSCAVYFFQQHKIATGIEETILRLSNSFAADVLIINSVKQVSENCNLCCGLLQEYVLLMLFYDFLLLCFLMLWETSNNIKLYLNYVLAGKVMLGFHVMMRLNHVLTLN